MSFHHPPETDTDPGGDPDVVVCAHTYYAHLLDRHAFVFMLPGTGQRFTCYDTDPGRYRLGAIYQLTLTRVEPPTPPPAPADAPHRPAHHHRRGNESGQTAA